MMEISPLQLHYFKREMLAIKLDSELELLQRRPELLALLQSERSTDDFQLLQMPFLHYMFQQIVVEFPLLKTSRKDTFWAKVHDFLQEAGKVQINTVVPSQTGVSDSQAMIRKLKKTLLLALNVGIKTVQGQEESVKVTPDDLAKLHTPLASPPLSPKDEERLEANTEQQKLGEQSNVLVDAKVVTVRTVQERGTLFRSAMTHDEFIICTTVESDEGIKTYYVARRHGHFRQLSDTLKNEFPDDWIPMKPVKFVQGASGNSSSTLLRERDRMLLNSYLRRIMSKPRIIKSATLFTFLTADPVQLLDNEILDAMMRRQLDDQRVEQSIRIRKEVDETVVALNDLLEMLKQQVMQPGGLTAMMDMIKETEQIADLPESLRKAFEWGRINFAFALHSHFVTDDAAADNVGTLKRTHSFLPYRTVSMILRFSNPMAMVKGVMNLFLAQPLGSKSLFQRIMAANMMDDVHFLEKEIKALEAKINDEVLCSKITNAVNTPATPCNQGTYTSPTLEVIELLGRNDIDPVLSPEQLAVLSGVASKKSRKLLKQLHNFWVLQTRKREQELLMTLAFQGITGEILKELFAIFYEPLAQVYKAANISDSINDISAFMDDLIQLLDNLDVTSVEENTVEPFVLLVQRHEQNFYHFVHRVHSQEVSDLFDKLVAYVDHILGSLTRGILPGRPLDLEEVLSDAGITPDMHSDLRREIDSLCEFRRLQKSHHLAQTRHKVIAHSKTIGGGSADGAVDGIDVAPNDYGDLMRFLPNNMDTVGLIHDIEDLDFQDSSAITESPDDDDDAFSGGETDDSDDINMATVATSSSTRSKQIRLAPPTLNIIPTIVPHFVSRVSKMMDAALLESRMTVTEQPVSSF